MHVVSTTACAISKMSLLFWDKGGVNPGKTQWGGGDTLILGVDEKARFFIWPVLFQTVVAPTDLLLKKDSFVSFSSEISIIFSVTVRIKSPHFSVRGH